MDTNVLIRFLVENDDQVQCAQARQLFLDHAIYISKTVFLETEWVLRANFQLLRGEIQEAFKKLLLLKNVYFEKSEEISIAVNHFVDGMDFADALHLASVPPHASFMSFDKKLIQKAKQYHQKVELL